MEINGIAHTFLTSGNFPAARAFYRQLLPFMGMKPVLDADGYYYCVGGRTALGIRASDTQDPDNRFDQSHSGLHHLCFRLRERGDVDELHRFLVEIGAHIVHPPQEDDRESTKRQQAPVVPMPPQAGYLWDRGCR